ncbi:uncharacterized protein Z519_03435 [Cladophialophora bantiana CBS 173.52]|uniref:3-carboxymuconate cyclase n=1 Tax=Cladophialophora bantiana (strain ATCC 10958 / CBS 173.52 / CDC B-1940 / NIH 8579) TaxID=1442370 RepID=A0A0D2F2C7_CLAB1|nr:uncharacterized protein Z519_03435 [Cladophialophora bantiana CBS 173.52]KIW96366.1 hypothetical protein Z519_03435 [Cladophialophora bantiana CBS 173.52]
MPTKFLQAFLLFTTSVAFVQAVPAPHAGKWGKGVSHSKGARAIYFITNDASNSVAAVPVAANGMLSEGTLTPTGGDGSNSISGATNEPAAPDALISQSALTVAGNNIFAVNAGSNTLSMLSIDPQDPTKLTVVGAPVSLPGQFPNTVAASASNRLVCVGTTGVTNGVSCSSFSKKGLGAMDGLRSFDLVQTTPPVGPTNTVSQLFFSEDESLLFATVKGDPTVNNTGFFSVFPVEGGNWHMRSSLSMTDIRSSPAGTAVLFGSQPIPGTSDVFVTDASFGGAVVSVDPTSNMASTVAKQEVGGQSATCWVTISPATGSAFVTDVGVNRVVEMSLTDASIVSILDLSANGDPGLIDLKAAGNFIYALSPGNGTTPAAVTVLDVSGGPGSAKQVQHFTLDGMGVDKNAQGMAFF